MLAKEREDKIMFLLEQNGAVTTSRLVSCLNVSIETIRKDLLSLENQGRLSRVHGGAVLNTDMKPYILLEDRTKEFCEQKKAIALKACEFINEGDIISIDCGSTSLLLAQTLKEKFSHLTVVTNSADVFNILKDCRDFKLILCGGYYINSENAFCGDFALDMLESLHVQKSFIFPSAVSLKHGLCDYDKDVTQIQKKLLQISDKVFILADSSKYEKQALLKIDNMRKEYFYITDSSLNKQTQKLYEENDFKIFLC